jgi:hypothetical protein
MPNGRYANHFPPEGLAGLGWNPVRMTGNMFLSPP